MDTNECERPDGHHDKRRKIEFTVDIEPLIAWTEGHTAELKVKEILDLSGNQPAEHYYLVEFTGEGHEHREKHEKLDETLHVKEHARFAAIYIGCTPVSDKGFEVELGVKRLKGEFEALGIACEGPLNSGGLEWLLLRNYPVPGGRCVGQVLHLAVAVPADFPQTPPGGLYISPKLIPDPEMPGLNIQHRPAETGELPGEWQYWSRPVPPGTWTPANAARRLLTHWNAVMMNV